MSDYISRGEVKAKLTQYVSTHVSIVLPHIQKIVNDIPSVDVRENIHGEWIRDDIYSSWKCSRCNTYAIEDFEHDEVRSRFCPDCGADMRGE